MIKSIEGLIEAAKQIPKKTLVVAVANDEAVLKSVEKARQEDIIHAVLVGDQSAIEDVLDQLGFDKTNYTIIKETDPEKACEKAVRLVSENEGYFLMKGLVDTKTILKAALDKDYGLRTKNRLSHLSVMSVKNYHKLMIMTDGAMNIQPTVDEKQEIIENAAKIAHALGIKKPNVGMIAAVEKVNPKMQATLDAKTLKERQQNGDIKDVIIDGPFAIDNAINKEAAKQKGITSAMAGDVDILMMPLIEAGNVFYKTMMFLADAKSASVIAGAQKPIVLTSRADSEASKFYSIALSALVANL